MGIHRLLLCLILTDHTRRPFPGISDFPHTKTCGIEAQRLWPIRHTQKKTQRRRDVSHSFSVSTAVQNKQPVIGSDSLSNAINRKPLTFEYFRRLKKKGQRDMRIEYALIALLVAFAGLQAYLAFGAKGI